MTALYLFVFACLLALQVNGLETVNGRIKITVQTTSGCRDARAFITGQLAPTYALYKDFLDVKFVPWGRATRRNDGTLRCQFGVKDCWANRLHRCSLNLLKDDLDAQIQFMTCEFTSPFPGNTQGSYECALAAGVSLVDVEYCVANSEDQLDLDAEKEGAKLLAATSFIPSIVFNDQYEKAPHDQAVRGGLKSMVCNALAADATTGVGDC